MPGAAPAAAAPTPAALADALADSWSRLQRADGSFPDSIRPASQGWGRYGEAGLGYGLMLAGLRARHPEWVQAGARAQRFAIAHAPDRLSAFESMLIASGYNLLRLRAPATPAFAERRDAWEAYLRDVRPLFDAAIDAPYLSSNKYLVEAVLGLELGRSQLVSGTPGTTLHVPGEARRRALHILNVLVPHRVAHVRGRAAGHRTTALSDRFAQPPAYHALVSGMLAHAIDLAGPAASRRARTALRVGVRTLWAYQSPDGDVAYLGRSQGQAWTGAFAALAADRAAGPGCGEQARDFIAVADRALIRLGALHPVGPAGMPIVPSAAGPATIPAIDDYAGDVVYNGLTLTGLGWAADAAVQRRPGCLPDAILAERRHAAARLPFEVARFTVLRRGDVWMAVKLRSQGADARAGFGLRALKLRGADGRWRDLLPAAPPRARTGSRSLGPVLIRRSGALAYAEGLRVDVHRGRLRIRGGWRDARGRWVRSGTFRFAPTGDGARIVVPTRRGDRIAYSALTTGRPATRRRGVDAPGATVRSSVAPSVIGVAGPLATTSTLDAWRADLTVRARGRQVAFTIAAR